MDSIKTKKIKFYILLHIITLFFSIKINSIYAKPQITVIAEGLFNPTGLAELPDKGVLIAEEGTSKDDFSGGISLLTSKGDLGRLISGISSRRESGDFPSTSLISIAPDGMSIYTGTFGLGHLWELKIKKDNILPALPFKPEGLNTFMLDHEGEKLINPFDIAFDKCYPETCRRDFLA